RAHRGRFPVSHPPPHPRFPPDPLPSSLRFSFVNVSEISPPSSAHLSANSSAPLNKNKSPVLARCFSDVFSVYSAKRFPGVVESTPLSRCFATQGIRIPIRKDAAKGEKEKDEDED
ncbi:hypothetical protein BGT96224_1799, partial [Blumeria graminis f. sp. tritici 96224]